MAVERLGAYWKLTGPELDAALQVNTALQRSYDRYAEVRTRKGWGPIKEGAVSDKVWQEIVGDVAAALSANWWETEHDEG